jgi:DNA invertase Pin-like site-specific DNA recombinase
VGHELRIVTGLEASGVAVKSLTNGIVDTTTAHGKLVFGMFALMAEYEAALIKKLMFSLCAGEMWVRTASGMSRP